MLPSVLMSLPTRSTLPAGAEDFDVPPPHAGKTTSAAAHTAPKKTLEAVLNSDFFMLYLFFYLKE